MGIREVDRTLKFGSLSESASRLTPQGYEGGVAPDTVVSKNQRFILVDLMSRPITADMVKRDNKKLRLTNGMYYIRYYGFGLKHHKKFHPFYIYIDLIDAGLKVSGPEMFKALAKQLPELQWVIENTTYDDCLFARAFECRGIGIPFSLDVKRYSDKLIAQGGDERSLFVTRKIPDDFAHIYKSVHLPRKKNQADLNRAYSRIYGYENVQDEIKNSVYTAEDN